MMPHMIRHSSLGVVLQLLFTGKVSFSHNPAEDVENKADDIDPRLEPESGKCVDNVSGTVQDTVVEWDNDDHPDNPQNWSTTLKIWISFVICLYTFTVYAGSSMYASAQDSIAEEFHVTEVESALGLALYVLGYGLGCLLLSPLTEIPLIGRNPPYAVSGLLFIILCIPAALVQNFAGLMVLRFLLGLMASPPLATAAASLGDIWHSADFPAAIGVWSLTTAMAPALGPTLSSYAVRNLGWRFGASWELLILVGPVILLLIVTVPETSGETILYYRARRLRDTLTEGKRTLGAAGLPRSRAEMRTQHLTASALLRSALVKPWEITIKDPALLFTTLYFGLVYGIYMTFFESLPLVFPVNYAFSPESTGLVFLGAIPSGVLALAIHATYMGRVAARLRDGSFGKLENLLVPGVIASWILPAGLFLYAWASRLSVHWIAPVIGLAVVMFGQYFVTQSIFAYIPTIYPRYAASIFAASSFARSVVAFAAVLFARPMFRSLDIAGGASLLAGLMVLCAVGMALLWRFGEALRRRSRFAD